jgi:hypothetical protein
MGRDRGKSDGEIEMGEIYSRERERGGGGARYIEKNTADDNKDLRSMVKEVRTEGGPPCW